MPRVILLSSFRKYKAGLISTNEFGDLVKFIERFHFIYNGLFSLRTNKLTSFYCEQSKFLSEAIAHDECIECINAFKRKLKSALPSETEFLSKIKELTYSKNEKTQKNVLSKLFLGEVENLLSGSKNSKLDSSVEHMLNEDVNRIETQRIDRLMLLEQDINNTIPSIPLIQKLAYYKKSNYSFSKQVVQVLDGKEENEINEVLDKWFEDNAIMFYRSVN